MAELTHDRLRQLLHYDPETGVFTRLVSAGGIRAGSVAGTISKKGKSGSLYRQIRVDGKFYLGHRLAVFFVTGKWPYLLVDHRDGDGLNNRWINLREADYSKNGQNSKCSSNNKCKIKGVTRTRAKNKWRACIRHNGRSLHLGHFDDQESAHAAYAAAAITLFGEFARIS